MIPALPMPLSDSDSNSVPCMDVFQVTGGSSLPVTLTPDTADVFVTVLPDGFVAVRLDDPENPEAWIEVTLRLREDLRSVLDSSLLA